PGSSLIAGTGRRVRERVEFALSLPHVTRVNRRFIRLVGVRNGYQYQQVPIDDMYARLELEHLDTRRTVADLVVLHKLVNGEMVCPDVLQLLNFKTPSSTRSNDLFIRQHYGTNYAANSTVARLQRAGNNLPITVDLFHDGVRTLKWKVKGAVLPT
ncbi:hypothetical protein J6590_094954, partial [Homalodisca vitripennis]